MRVWDMKGINSWGAHRRVEMDMNILLFCSSRQFRCIRWGVITRALFMGGWLGSSIIIIAWRDSIVTIISNPSSWRKVSARASVRQRECERKCEVECECEREREREREFTVCERINNLRRKKAKRRTREGKRNWREDQKKKKKKGRVQWL